ncbi:HEAT repeat domain-containing protein [Dactylosporangium sp. NPDC050588]|uniref:HEAT repeat domain-containing protein n=1 Tax=Dactylosporangium sp. NPDC050588 TaxID=3157211 RepID=UPI0033D98238
MTGSQAPGSPLHLSTAELFAAAEAEVRDDDSEWHWEHLVALHERATPEVFRTAWALAGDADPRRRELGVRVMREVGRDDPAAADLRRGNWPVLLDLLDRETHPDVLPWVVSATGYNEVPGALPAVLRLAGHPDAEVRFRVAASIPSLVDPAAPEEAALAALRVLTEDDDEDVREYASYGLVEELGAGI